MSGVSVVTEAGRMAIDPAADGATVRMDSLTAMPYGRIAESNGNTTTKPREPIADGSARDQRVARSIA